MTGLLRLLIFLVLLLPQIACFSPTSRTVHGNVATGELGDVRGDTSGDGDALDGSLAPSATGGTGEPIEGGGTLAYYQLTGALCDGVPAAAAALELATEEEPASWTPDLCNPLPLPLAADAVEIWWPHPEVVGLGDGIFVRSDQLALGPEAFASRYVAYCVDETSTADAGIDALVEETGSGYRGIVVKAATGGVPVHVGGIALSRVESGTVVEYRAPGFRLRLGPTERTLETRIDGVYLHSTVRCRTLR